jgi:hypothetical protein
MREIRTYGLTRERVPHLTLSTLLSDLSPCPPCLSGVSDFPVLFVNHYRGTERDVVIESYRHFTGHPDTAVRGRVPGEIAFVHADSSGDAHEIRHGCALEDGAGRFRVFAQFDIFLDHIARGIDVITVKAGGVIRVFLNNLIASRRGVMTLAASRDLRDTDELIALIKVGAFFTQVDLYRRCSSYSITVPIRNRIISGCSLRSGGTTRCR